MEKVTGMGLPKAFTEKMQKLFTQIQEIAEELTNPSLPDNQHAVITRK